MKSRILVKFKGLIKLDKEEQTDYQAPNHRFAAAGAYNSQGHFPVFGDSGERGLSTFTSYREIIAYRPKRDR